MPKSIYYFESLSEREKALEKNENDLASRTEKITLRETLFEATRRRSLGDPVAAPHIET